MSEIKNAEELLKLLGEHNSEKWQLDESICRQCGLCCHEKVLDENKVIRYLPTRCQWQREDKKCQIYGNRFAMQPGCLNARGALMMCVLPFQCAYVQANWHLIKDWYRPPILPKPRR